MRTIWGLRSGAGREWVQQVQVEAESPGVLGSWRGATGLRGRLKEGPRGMPRLVLHLQERPLGGTHTAAEGDREQRAVFPKSGCGL